MCDHGHHGSGCCAAEAPTLNVDEGSLYDMHRFIDLDRVVTLNEITEDSGRLVFKVHEERKDQEKFVESDADEELLFNIPFTGHVKLTGMKITGPAGSRHPAHIRLFKDRPSMAFSDTEVEAEQELDLKMDVDGSVDYPLKASKFASVSHLSIHVNKNFGADSTKIFYIGLRGEFQHAFRERVVIATYEARAIPEDHKNALQDSVGKTIH